MSQSLYVLFAGFWLLSLPGYSQPVTEKDYHLAVGALGTYQAIGLQAELSLPYHFGVRLAGVKELGHERTSEYAYTNIGLLTYTFTSYIPFLEPTVALGGVYSIYHWDLLNTTGNIYDLSIGGGFALNFRFSQRSRAGANLFVLDTFKARYDNREMRMIKEGRKMQVFPVLSLDFLFLR